MKYISISILLTYLELLFLNKLYQKVIRERYNNKVISII